MINRVKTFLSVQDSNAVSYLIGLVMLFIGLAVGVSTATALIIVGSAVAAESVVTSYILTWMSGKKK